MRKLRRRLPRIIRKIIPFQGQYALESQILWLVFQWRNDGQEWSLSTRKRAIVGSRRFLVWYDSAWRR